MDNNDIGYRYQAVFIVINKHLRKNQLRYLCVIFPAAVLFGLNNGFFTPDTQQNIYFEFYLLIASLSAIALFLCFRYVKLIKKSHSFIHEQNRQSEKVDALTREVESLKIHEKEAKKNKRKLAAKNTELTLLRKAAIDMMEDLKSSKQKADAANAAKSRFLAIMSHEIRTPMNGVLGMTQVLKETQLTELQYESLNIIESSGTHLLTIINDILDFSKIEENKISLEKIPFDLQEGVHELCLLMHPLATENNTEIFLHYSPDCPKQFIGDPYQILTNLLSNAVKFTKSGQVSIEITFGENYETSIVISDTGIGITPDRLDDIFSMFTQVDSSITRKFGGTGLGLAISKQLVELMGGSIAVESTENAGTCFTVHLPLPIEQINTPFGSEFENTKVLVISERDLIKRTTLAWLKYLNIHSKTTASMHEGIASLQGIEKENDYFNAIIVDQNSPNSSIVLFHDALQKLKISPRPPIILICNDLNTQQMPHIKALNIHHFIQSPFNSNQLIKMLRLAMNPQLQNIREYRINNKPKLSFDIQVLIADDVDVNRIIVEAMLTPLGITTHLAINGCEAVEIYKTEKIDLILMDYRMPIMDGLEATQKIRAIESFHTPIIALTANAQDEDRDACFAAGMDDFLSKPCKIKTLTKTLQRWVPKEKQRIESSPNRQ